MGILHDQSFGKMAVTFVKENKIQCDSAVRGEAQSQASRCVWKATLAGRQFS